MTLTNRLSLFSLVALGIVLCAFSVTIYLLARTHLLRQSDERVQATLDTLIAIVEIEDDGLEWERHNRRLSNLEEGGVTEWGVFDESGQRLDGAGASPFLLPEFAQPNTHQRGKTLEREGISWRILSRTLEYPEPENVRSTPSRLRYRQFVFVAVCSLESVSSTLRQLAWSLVGVSLFIWSMAGLTGRWFCRRALAPVIRMTEAAKHIHADDLHEQLPLSESNDELRDLALSFNELLTRLREAFARQSRFTAEASHQLRTPLTAMLGHLEVALRREREPAEYKRVLTTAIAQAERLRQIIESLLFLTRADNETEMPGLEMIDLRDCVKQYLETHPIERSSDFTFTMPTNPIKVKVQQAMLTQVLSNLVENACKYSPIGSPIKISVQTESNEAVISVEDKGYGIDSEEANRIFEPFFRSAEARRRGTAGTGLGLSVASRIVHSFGGRLEVQSKIGEGSRFEVHLPLA